MPIQRHYPNWLILLLLAMAPAGPSSAQEYCFSHLTSQDGLASNNVQAITQDRDGFWWFGTKNGLQRFDGLGFRTYRHIAGDSTSLLTDIVIGLFSDSKGRLWVGTAEGLCRFRKEEEIFIPALTLDGKIVAEVSGDYRFLEDSRGEVWVAAPEAGLLRYRPEKDRWEQMVPRLQSEQPPLFSHLTEEPETGNIWFGDRFRIGYYDRQRQEIVSSREQPQAHPAFSHFTTAISLLIDQEDNLWVIDGDSLKFDLYGILRYNLRSGVSKRYAVNIFGHLFQDTRGSVWINTGNNSVGLGWYDREHDTIRFIQRRPGDPYSIRYGWPGLSAWYEDREGNIWLGSTEGISVFNPYDQRFFALPDPESGKEEWKANALCFLETRLGEIWIGTYFEGLYVLDRNFRFLRRIYYPPDGRRSEEGAENFSAIWALYQSRSGHIWAGGQHGTLQRFSLEGKLLGRWQPPELRRETIRCIFEDESGDLWLGTQKGALVRLNLDSGRFSRFSLKRGCQILQALPAGNNTFWLTSNCKAIFRWDATSETVLETVAPTEQLTAGRRRALDAVSLSRWNDDTLLVAGVNALYFYDTKTGSLTFPEELEALPSRSIAFFQILSPEEVWIGTGARLVRWAPRRRKITEFGPADGIRAETFDNLNSVLRLRDGRILFSGSSRVYSFHPGRISERKPPPPVTITAVRTGKQSLDADWQTEGRVDLPYRQNFLTIEFAALSWQQRNGLRYECRLLGWEDDWQDYGPNRQAGYVRLFPGRYTFQVRARNADGLASQTVAKLVIRIRPPLWLRAWFLILATVALFLAARRSIRSHYRRKAELQRLELAHRLAVEQERLRIARDMHDDLGSGISALGLQAEIARRRTRSRQAAAELDKIARSAAELAVRIRETIWLINSRNDTLDHLAGFLYQYAAELLENSGLAWTFHLPADLPPVAVPGEQRRALFLSFKEALNNALKHAAAGSLEIDLHLEGPSLLLTIADNGRGMHPSAARLKNGNGLRNMEERMAEVGGAFRIESGIWGTKVQLELPL